MDRFKELPADARRVLDTLEIGVVIDYVGRAMRIAQDGNASLELHYSDGSFRRWLGHRGPGGRDEAELVAAMRN